MSRIQVGQENSTPIELYYEDHGSGRPVVLIHGWPLSAASWERQVPALLEAGHRVVAYDRRGFGRSSQPAVGYEYDTLAADLDALLTRLDLREATLVGFSMGGGEVARYLAKRGAARVRKAVFIAAIPPYLLKAGDNPGGVDGGVFEGIRMGLLGDRPGFLARFLQDFYNVDVLGNEKISKEAVQLSWAVACGASPIGTVECVKAWTTDFRADLAALSAAGVPTLVIHGDADRIVPYGVSGERIAQAVEGAKRVTLEGAPHGCLWTHADRVNAALVDFLK
jgi:pimeloyl-ACP methyl ester carboxylesterase